MRWRYIINYLYLYYSKRPSVDECMDHSWLAENDLMVKKRERAAMQSFRLQVSTFTHCKGEHISLILIYNENHFP